MQSSDDGSTPPFRNAFLSEFLGCLAERDEPSVAAEADAAGPWRVLEIPARFGVFRIGQTAPRRARPFAAFTDHTHALLAAALIPGTGRDPLFEIQKDPSPDGYAVYRGANLVGHLTVFDEKLVDALHVAECLLRSPESLANLLEAAGAVVLERTGAILRERVGLGGGLGEE